MKIKVIEKSYQDVLKIEKPVHLKPVRNSKLLASLVRIIGAGDLKATNFKCHYYNMTEIKDDEPCLILMNHSSFIDLEMVFKILKKRRFNIVSTDDGFVGKYGLMRKLGCIPTYKFVNDTVLVKDMIYTIRTLKSSVLMFPEASYSFDGTATPLPSSLGKLVKLLGVPVIMIRTHGAFLRDPLYNNLQKRKVDVSCEVYPIVSKEECSSKSIDEINDLINNEFGFDNFKEQYDNSIIVNEPFRSDKLNRVLYKCSCCECEGKMEGSGVTLKCNNCNTIFTLEENGRITGGNNRFNHIPDWYKWERECVRNEIINDNYKLDIDVDICILKDYKAIYKVGSGHLYHDKNGFKLTGIDGELEYNQDALSSYSLYADYYWYEIGDMICIGDTKMRYYLFPKDHNIDCVAKTRLATEEIYKLLKDK